MRTRRRDWAAQRCWRWYDGWLSTMSDLGPADPPRWMELPSERQARIREVLRVMVWRSIQQERLCQEAADDNVPFTCSNRQPPER